VSQVRSKFWRRIISAADQELWVARCDDDRLVITQTQGARTARAEIYALSAKEAAGFVKRWGGRVLPMTPPARWLNDGGAPVRIRDRLVVVSEENQRTRFPGRQVLVLPAGMAFGTGRHATTAGCLRLLSDEAKRRDHWSCLDLGTGSGILAMAAALFGASPIEAGDFDRDCLRIARENAEANHLADAIKFRHINVLSWQPRRRWDVVTANLYSSVLIEAAPQICSAVAAGGVLIISGILRTQEKETLRAFRNLGLQNRRIMRHGKWLAALLARAGKTVDAPEGGQ
jgi:ribosomal protein L11 methyltransferase